MRRWIAGCLALVLLCCAAPALGMAGEALQVEVSYPGAWLSFAGAGFKLYVPSGWLLVESEEAEAAFVMVSADGKQAMWIDVYASDGVTIDGLLEHFSAEKSLENVRAVYFNGVAFVCYTSPGSDVFGAVTMSADGSTLYFFKFLPESDAALQTLATGILSTLTPDTEAERVEEGQAAQTFSQMMDMWMGK